MGQKSLIYAFVARGTVILADYTEFSGNFNSIAFQCLQKLPASNNKFTYNCDGHTFNYLVDNGFTYCVVADESAGRQVPMAFLERVKDDFLSRYGSGKAATTPANGLNKEFGSKLKEHMQYCADHPEEISKLVKVKAQVSEVKGVMMENIEKNLCKMPSGIAKIRLVSSHRQVYEPCDDSFALVDALLADRDNLLEHYPTICMEIGCGSGYVITSLALMLGKEAQEAYYIATDINPHALRVTRETLEAHGVHAELMNTDIASGLDMRLTGLVDVMVVNPPYVPTPEEEVGCAGIASAWAGGENGRRVIDKILPIADRLLSNRGWLYMVFLTANNPTEICLQMGKKGYASRIVVQRSTEEESLHVIKFWRDFDHQAEEHDGQTTFLESLLSQFPILSIWRQDKRP